MMEDMVRHKGRIAQTRIYLGKMLRMFAYQNDWKDGLQAVSEGKLNLKPLITHHFPLSECNTALEMMRDRTEFYNKVMLDL